MNLNDLKYKAEDFATIGWKPGQEELAAERANQLLCERLGRAPKVFGVLDGDDWSLVRCRQGEFYGDTHTARLVCVEEIKK